MSLGAICCYQLENNPPAQKSIIVSRMFGEPVEDIERLKEAMATYAARAGEKIKGAKAGGRGDERLLGTFPPPSSPSPRGASSKVIAKWKDNLMKKRIWISSLTERMSLYLLNI